MTKNILLLNDVTDEVFLSRTLGPYKVASALRNNGYKVQVIDFLHTFSLDEIEEALKDFIDDNTLFVGFNTFFYKNISQQNIINNGNEWESGGINYGEKVPGALLPHGIEFNERITNLIKTCNKNCKLVLGGPDAQVLPYIKYFDYTIIGYADNSVVNLANHLAKNEPLKNAKKSLYKSIVIDDAKAEGYNFSETPMFFHENDLIVNNESLVTEISRGCIFNCAFCSYPLNGKKKNDFIKLKNILLKEFIYHYKNFGVTRYIFSDDTFNDSIEKIELMYQISKELPFKLEYWAYIRLDLLTAHKEHIDKLFDSGLRACHFGIETLNKKTASLIGKGGDRDKMFDTVKYIKNKYGNSVSLNGTFIFGLPEESVESMKETGDALVSGESGLDSWYIHPLFIGTQQKKFLSKIELNYSEYGYTLLEWDQSINAYNWKNQHTCLNECSDLAYHYQVKGSKVSEKKINPLRGFYACIAGVNLEYTFNKPESTFDYHSLVTKKEDVSKKYKEKLFKILKSKD